MAMNFFEKNPTDKGNGMDKSHRQLTAKDWLLNFPSEGATYLDLYKNVTIALNTAGNIVLTWTVPPNLRAGVIKKFGAGYFSGDGNQLSYLLTINGTPFPYNQNQGSFMALFVPVYALDDTHLEIKGGDVIQVVFNNASLINPASVWARLKGWFYAG
jgi:hypothetical protein